MKPQTLPLSEVLKNYFDDSAVLEFEKLLNKKYFLKTGFPRHISRENKKQLAYQTPASVDFNTQINLAVTFAESKLAQNRLIDFLLYLGEFSIAKGELISSLDVYDFLIHKIRKNKLFNSVVAYSVLAKADIYSRMAEWDKSYRFIQKAKKYFIDQNDYRGSARCENILGTIYGDLGKLKKAISHFEKSLSFLNSKKDTGLIGMLEMNIGILNNIQSKHEAAFIYFNRAFNKFRQLGDKRRIAELKHNFGMYYMNRGDFVAGMKEFDESIAYSIEGDYLHTIALSYSAKSFLYSQTKDFALADAFAGKAMEISHKLGDKLSIADIYKIKGIIEKQKGNITLAEQFLLSSIRLNQELENPLNLSEASYEMALLCISQQKHKEAITYLENSLKGFVSLNVSIMISKVQELIKEERDLLK